MMTKKAKTAKQAYQQNLGNARKTLKRVEQLLAIHEREAGADPDWGHAGDISYALDLLHQTAAFLADEEA